MLIHVTDFNLMDDRVLDKGSVKGKPRNLMIASDDILSVGSRPKKGDKLHKRKIHPIDGDKYMSCIKVGHFPHFFFSALEINTQLLRDILLAVSYVSDVGSWWDQCNWFLIM